MFYTPQKEKHSLMWEYNARQAWLLHVHDVRGVFDTKSRYLWLPNAMDSTAL